MSIIHMYVLKLLFHSTTLTVSHEYNTAFFLVFFLLFFFSCLLDCLRLGRGATAPEGEKGGEEEGKRRKKEVGWQTELDMSPVFIHRWRVIGSVSSVCGLCCCQESIRGGEGGGEREGRCRVKGRGVGKRSRG